MDEIKELKNEPEYETDIEELEATEYQDNDFFEGEEIEEVGF